MEKAIKEKFNEAILHEVMGRYGIAASEIRLLDGFESFIYEFDRGPAQYILRIAHSTRRSEGLIQGEAHWINYLAGGGATVAQAILSRQERLVEAVDDGLGGQFLATAFVKAPGRPPRQVETAPDYYERYGRLLGRMHALTRGYVLPDPAWKRPEWDDPIMLDVTRNLPPAEALAVEKYEGLLAHAKTLPKDGTSYGLIHWDAHEGNLFVDKAGTITLFDFDDCLYGWFAYDIAIVLLYAVMGQPDPAGFTRAFLSDFFRGYRQENRLDPAWLAEIPVFLKLREIDLYAVIHRSFDVENLDSPWCARFMAGRKERIENDVPFVDFDFTSLAGCL